MSSPEIRVVLVVAIIAVHFVFREAVFEHARVRRGQVSFPPVYGLRATFWIGIPLFLFAAYKVTESISTSMDWFFPVLYLALAALIFFSYPATLLVDDRLIIYRRYLGLLTKQIKMEEVTSVVHSSVEKTISVFARDGRSIVHTRFNVDPFGFEAALESRLQLSVIKQ